MDYTRVLAVDQSGHGTSTTPSSISDGFCVENGRTMRCHHQLVSRSRWPRTHKLKHCIESAIHDLQNNLLHMREKRIHSAPCVVGKQTKPRRLRCRLLQPASGLVRMPAHCVAVGCKNYFYGKPGIKYFQFPCAKFYPKKREAWIAAVRRKNEDGSSWTPGPHSRLCSAHFITGRSTLSLSDVFRSP